MNKESSDYNVIEAVKKFTVETLNDEQTKNNPEMVAAIAKLLDVTSD